MNHTVLIESQYLPPLEFFSAILSAQKLLIETNESYRKQTYRNRCRIPGPNRVLDLIVPISHGTRLMGEIEINYSHTKWYREHWRALETCYNKAPFMDHYGPAVRDILSSRPVRLLELNTRLLTFCLDQLGITVEIAYTERFSEEVEEEGIVDLRGRIIPKKPWKERPFYKPVPYFQQFGKTFEPNMSIIDLLMNTGPEALSFIRNSEVK